MINIWIDYIRDISYKLNENAELYLNINSSNSYFPLISCSCVHGTYNSVNNLIEPTVPPEERSK